MYTVESRCIYLPRSVRVICPVEVFRNTTPRPGSVFVVDESRLEHACPLTFDLEASELAYPSSRETLPCLVAVVMRV